MVAAVVSCSVLTEWVNLPGDPGPAALSEVVCQEPHPERHVVDDGGVVGRGLVSASKSSIRSKSEVS